MLFAVFVGAPFAPAGLRVLRRRANLFHFPRSGRNLKSSRPDIDISGADTPFLLIWSGASSPRFHPRPKLQSLRCKAPGNIPAD